MAARTWRFHAVCVFVSSLVGSANADEVIQRYFVGNSVADRNVPPVEGCTVVGKSFHPLSPQSSLPWVWRQSWDWCQYDCSRFEVSELDGSLGPCTSFAFYPDGKCFFQGEGTRLQVDPICNETNPCEHGFQVVSGAPVCTGKRHDDFVDAVKHFDPEWHAPIAGVTGGPDGIDHSGHSDHGHLTNADGSRSPTGAALGSVTEALGGAGGQIANAASTAAQQVSDTVAEAGSLVTDSLTHAWLKVARPGQPCNPELHTSFGAKCQDGQICDKAQVPDHDSWGICVEAGKSAPRAPTEDVGLDEACNPSLPPQLTPRCADGLRCEVSSIPGAYGKCVLLQPDSDEGLPKSIVGEDKQCNLSLPPGSAVGCEDGLYCKTPAERVGSWGTCVKQPHFDGVVPLPANISGRHKKTNGEACFEGPGSAFSMHCESGLRCNTPSPGAWGVCGDSVDGPPAAPTEDVASSSGEHSAHSNEPCNPFLPAETAVSCVDGYRCDATPKSWGTCKKMEGTLAIEGEKCDLAQPPAQVVDCHPGFLCKQPRMLGAKGTCVKWDPQAATTADHTDNPAQSAFNSFAGIFSGAAAAVTGAVSSATEGLTGTVQNEQDHISHVAGAAHEKLTKATDGLSSASKSAHEMLTGAVDSAVTSTHDTVANGGSALNGMVSDTVEGATLVVNDAAGKVDDESSSLHGAATDPASPLHGAVLGSLNGATAKVGDLASAAVDGAVSTASDVAGQAADGGSSLPGMVTSAAGDAASTAWDSAGKVADGGSALHGMVTDAVDHANSVAHDATGKALDAGSSLNAATAADAGSSIHGMLSNAVDSASSVATDAADKVSDAGSSLHAATTDTGNSIQGMVSSAVDGATSVATDATEQVRDQTATLQDAREVGLGEACNLAVLPPLTTACKAGLHCKVTSEEPGPGICFENSGSKGTDETGAGQTVAGAVPVVTVAGSTSASESSATSHLPTSKAGTKTVAGYYYYPHSLVGTEKEIVTDWHACYEKCHADSACQHFGYWQDGGCHLQGAGSLLTKAACSDGSDECPALHVVSGPRDFSDRSSWPNAEAVLAMPFPVDDSSLNEGAKASASAGHFGFFSGNAFMWVFGISALALMVLFASIYLNICGSDDEDDSDDEEYYAEEKGKVRPQE